MTDPLPVVLSPHRQRFVDAYMAHRVASRAAIAAGFSATGGSRLLAECRPEIERRLAIAREASEITEARIARGLAEIAHFDPGEMFDDEGRLLPIKKMPACVRRAIASIEVEALFDTVDGTRMQVGTTTKIKFWNKNAALDSLGKYAGMYVERVKIEGRMLQYVIQVPAPAGNSAEWAKQVQSAVVREDKERT